METTQALQNESNFLRNFDGKDAIDSFVKYQCSLIENGEIDPLQFHIHSKALQKALDNIWSQIKDQVISEAGKYGNKKFEAFNAKIELSDVGVSYKFDECNDPNWNELSKQMESLKEAMKERESFLKTLKSPITIADEETGEMITINPAIRKGSEGIKISF